CPQRFAAPLAPHLAARAEGRVVDDDLLRAGIRYWQARSDLVLVEGAGGLLSPVSESCYCADLAGDFGYPLLVVAPNTLGAINATLQTLIAATAWRPRLIVAGIVLSDVHGRWADASAASNRTEIERRCGVSLVTSAAWQATALDDVVDWFAVAGQARVAPRTESATPGRTVVPHPVRRSVRYPG
ncbi:MAG: hypothetical protein A2W31_15500, partial [Planctomycetes bacterium RBG_16_64_10]